jgi:hypothetical protein
VSDIDNVHFRSKLWINYESFFFGFYILWFFKMWKMQHVSLLSMKTSDNIFMKFEIGSSINICRILIRIQSQEMKFNKQTKIHSLLNSLPRAIFWKKKEKKKINYKHKIKQIIYCIRLKLSFSPPIRDKYKKQTSQHC